MQQRELGGQGLRGIADGLGGARFGPRRKRDLIDRCASIRTYVEQRKLADDAELAGVWPKSQRASVWDWVYCYAQLVRFLERESLSTGGDRASAERAALAMLEERPEDVRLSNGETVSVYPKSYATLEWLDVRDALLQWLDERELDLRRAISDGTVGVAEPLTLLEQLVKERAAQLAEIAAQVCAPGPALQQVSAEPFTRLAPQDYLAIHAAHLRVNALRLTALRQLTLHRRSGSGQTVSWATLFATAAEKWKVSPHELIRDRSLASVLTEMALALRPSTLMDEVA